MLYLSLLMVYGAMAEIFDGSHTCKKDNWGMPLQDPDIQRAIPGYYNQFIQNPCAVQWVKTETAMSDRYSMTTAIHSKNTEDYDAFRSIDLVPENRDRYATSSLWGDPSKYDFDSVAPKSMRIAECRIETTTEDRIGIWDISRMGPFHSTGGYDWIQIGWDDVWKLSSVLTEHPEGIFILEQYMNPVLQDGTRLNHPPLHIHHMHIGPAPYVRQRFSPMQCALYNKDCFNPNRTLETHGDYNCIEDEGGLDCHIERFPEGYGKLITTPLGVEGEINDVRATNSPLLTWYWEMGIRWIPYSTVIQGNPPSVLKAMSLHNIAGPGVYDSNVQKSLLITFPSPTSHETMFWYTGRLKDAGKLLRMKLHAHNSLFDEALFFAATPSQLGLSIENGFEKQLPFQPLRPGSVGFSDNQALKTFILDTLQVNQEKFDQSNDAKVAKSNICGYPHSSCLKARPELICQSHTSVLEIEGFAYDRRQPTCCIPWEWDSGQPFTVVGFNKHMGYPVGPHKPDKKNIPATLPAHVGYWMSYDSKETPQQSHWGYSLYNHYQDGGLENPRCMQLYQKVAMMLNKYSSPHFNDWTKVPNAVPALTLSFIVTYPWITGTVLFILIFGLYLQCSHMCFSKKRDCGVRKKSDDVAAKLDGIDLENSPQEGNHETAFLLEMSNISK